MYSTKNWSCDLLMPCFHCLENGFDCQYDKYLDKVNLYERFSLNSDDEVENPLSLKEKLLKTYILNNYINSDKELDGRFLEIISENEIFLQKDYWIKKMIIQTRILKSFNYSKTTLIG